MKTDLVCPSCGMLFDKLRTASHTDDPPELGSILLCGNCATVSEVDLVGVAQPMTREAFEQLTPAEQRDFQFAVRSCLAYTKNFAKNKQDFIHHQ